MVRVLQSHGSGSEADESSDLLSWRGSENEFTNDGSEQGLRWWASGPPGPNRFLLLLEGELLRSLRNYGLTSGECLGFNLGWVADLSSLFELAVDAESDQ